MMKAQNSSSIKTIVGFGSRARGENTPAADLDVLVFAAVADDLVSLSQEVQRLLPAERPDENLDVHFYSARLAPTLAFEILRDAKVLYEISPGQGALDLAELALVAEPAPPPLQLFLQVKKMGQEETLRKIERRLISLERKLAGLAGRFQSISESQFLHDELLQEFAFARLYKITQDVIDLAALLIALEGRIPPAAGLERLEVLGEMELISPELSARLVNMARFRDVLAHIYEELDLVRLYRFATSEIEDLEAFDEAVKSYLTSRL
jgi:uncharacterized protein YutE (UPF0331/DUF86 family)/predicted nucleotidyltransferase